MSLRVTDSPLRRKASARGRNRRSRPCYRGHAETESIASAAGNQAIQWRAAQSGDEKLSAAPKTPFPYQSEINSSLSLNFPYKSVVDSAGCAARNTPAFTQGDTTHFAEGRPSLHVAAHEAAHQLQHAGMTKDGGLGAEGHAHVIADGIAKGAGVKHLITNKGVRVPHGTRKYTEVEGGRLSDDRRTFTSGKLAYAEAGLISGAASVLESQNSGVRIWAGGTSTFTDPQGIESGPLSRIEVQLSTDPYAHWFPDFYDDCGRAAREVMGPSGIDNSPCDNRWVDQGVWDGDCSLQGRQRTPARSPRVVYPEEGYLRETPEGMYRTKDPIEIIGLMVYVREETAKTEGYAKLTPLEKEEKRKEIHQRYANLSKAEKEKLIQRVAASIQKMDASTKARLGLNEYAKPQVGEAFAIRDPRVSSYDEGAYHWAAVIIVTSTDSVTLESFTKRKRSETDQEAYDKTNYSWYFQTYGSSKGKSFHSEYEKQMGGPDAVTVRTRTHSKEADDVSIHRAVNNQDYTRAFKILNGQSMPMMLKTLSSGIAYTLHANSGMAKGVNLGRIQIALGAVMFGRVPDSSPGWSALPPDQRQAIRDYLGASG